MEGRLEIKWRDATTDGDHITKEHTRIRAIRDAGYKPVRVMFYYPNRAQAMRIQQTLESLYKSVKANITTPMPHGLMSSNELGWTCSES